MASIATSPVAGKPAAKPRIAIVDSDVHHGPFDELEALGPYLSKTYRERLADYGGGGVGDIYTIDKCNGGGVVVDGNVTYHIP